MCQAATRARRNRKPYLLSAVSTETCQRSARSTRQTHPDPSVCEHYTTGKGSRWKKTLENICELHVTSTLLKTIKRGRRHHRHHHHHGSVNWTDNKWKGKSVIKAPAPRTGESGFTVEHR